MMTWRAVAAVLIFVPPLLSACGKSTVSVSVHGVNYSAEAFSYSIADPSDKTNIAGGELVEPYASGGTSCCYELPKRWPGALKIVVRSTHWLPPAPDGHLPEVVETQAIDIPRFASGEAGELWILRMEDGRISVISSNLQPDHAQWPGRVKGWPVPSLAYQRERWDLFIDHKKAGLEAYEKLQRELRDSPDAAAQAAWDYALADDAKSLIDFAGPKDVAFRGKLKRDYESGIERIKSELNALEMRRP